MGHLGGRAFIAFGASVVKCIALLATELNVMFFFFSICTTVMNLNGAVVSGPFFFPFFFLL